MLDPKVSSNPYDDDMELNNISDKGSKSTMENAPSSSTSKRAAKVEAKTLYKKELLSHNPRRSGVFTTQSKSSGLAADATSAPREHKFGGLLAKWGWVLTVAQLCCCASIFAWAVFNVLLTFAGTYFYNKSKESLALGLCILALLSGILMAIVVGPNFSQVATQFFTLK